MCLKTNRKRFTIAKKDIVCYKTIHPIYKDVYEPIYIDDSSRKYNCISKYEIGKTYKEKYEIPIGKYMHLGIHSFIYLKDAQSNRQAFQVIVECVIPKGSKYVTGEGYYIPGKQYVSNRIKIVKIIK